MGTRVQAGDLVGRPEEDVKQAVAFAVAIAVADQQLAYEAQGHSRLDPVVRRALGKVKRRAEASSPSKRGWEEEAEDMEHHQHDRAGPAAGKRPCRV